MTSAPVRGCPGILPPSMLERIVLAGSAEQRERALATLATDATLRLVRAVAPAPRPRAWAATARPSPQRTITDAGGTTTLPGRAVRQEGQAATQDPAVSEAYDGLGATFAFFLQAYGRDSVDDQGLPLQATVHYGKNYDNAFWDGSRMVFGDGDTELFQRFTRSLDVIGHELAHGVTQDEAGLVYSGQSGALNESMSDVLGSLVKQFALGQEAAAADWLIGADLLAPGVQGRALRDMAHPGSAYDDPVLGTDGQVGRLADYVDTTADNGGVHTNSGIPSLAFVTVAQALGGPAWEQAGRIWYDTLRDPRLRPNATFRSFAGLTQTVAATRYGAEGEQVRAVRAGWAAVGMDLA